MVPVEALTTETYDGEEGEDDEGDDFLHYLQLHQGIGATVALESNAVGGDLKTVFEEGETPRDEDDDEDGGFALEDTDILQFEMAIPRENHKDIAHYEECDGEDVLHF